MPDYKITDYTAATGATLDGADLFEIVDVSDTTMDATGTNEKLSVTELLVYLNANGMPRRCKQSSVLTNSTTTLADVPGMSFSVTSGRRYMFHFMGTYQSAATTTGIGFAFSGPSMTNSGFISRVRQAANGTDTLFDATQPNAFTTQAASASVVAANTSYMWEVHGYCTPSADGTIQLRAASEVAASQITVDNVGSGYIIDCG